MGRVLIYSFAAATLGGLDSLGGAVVAGIIIGLVQTMAGGYIDAIGVELAPAVALAGDRRRPARQTERPVRQRNGWSASDGLDHAHARARRSTAPTSSAPGLLVALGLLYVTFAYELPVSPRLARQGVPDQPDQRGASPTPSPSSASTS